MQYDLPANKGFIPPKLIDTLAAMTKVEGLDRDLFRGSAETADDSGVVSRRWYRNDEDKPRVTYYPASSWLRVEWSAHKFGYGEVQAYLARDLSLSVPPVESWRCQRVDYCVDLEVASVAPYLAALARLRAGAMQRQTYPDGVVWKAAGRWVKMYDGKRHAREGVLRFEVSNYKQSVRYMAEHWFGCERTVAEMTQPGRALYVLGRMWQTLGLDQGFAQQQGEVYALREAFGQRSLAGALHAVKCIREHGVASYKTLMLMSKSSYYRWYQALRDKGFLASSESDLCALQLPCESVFAHGAQNLKVSLAPPIDGWPTKNTQKNWQKLAAVLGVKSSAPRVKYLQEAFDAWKPGLNLDSVPRAMQASGSFASVPRFTPGPLVGVVAIR